MTIDYSEEDDKYLKSSKGTFEYLERLCQTNNVDYKIYLVLGINDYIVLLYNK